ncbi:protein of unknown function [Litoreibacter ascidiaceicola]|uniref:eCIS core domain-containing protein n=1 Tax=Litoreibacter ascidiaceicola TaxID=1486859 RepID=A0A1M5AZN0_9RHOB|nr:DUF4157 domain-containing protein [Litoreibacter ascidiaceicola]SHF35724.1 protein of unknown function [Litoreibacter ascidiaceicola]
MHIKTPVSAAHFSLSIDGAQIASFSELQGVSSKANTKAAPRKLLAHELTHTAQQMVGVGRVAVSVKTADLGPAAAQKLRGSVGRMVTISATNPQGGVAASYQGKLMTPERAASGETVTIVCDHLQRASL